MSIEKAEICEGCDAGSRVSLSSVIFVFSNEVLSVIECGRQIKAQLNAFFNLGQVLLVSTLCGESLRRSFA